MEASGWAELQVMVVAQAGSICEMLATAKLVSDMGAGALQVARHTAMGACVQLGPDCMAWTKVSVGLVEMQIMVAAQAGLMYKVLALANLALELHVAVL